MANPPRDNERNNTFSKHFASLVAFEGSLTVDFGDFLFDDFVDFIFLFVHFLFEFINQTGNYAQLVNFIFISRYDCLFTNLISINNSKK